MGSKVWISNEARGTLAADFGYNIASKSGEGMIKADDTA